MGVFYDFGFGGGGSHEGYSARRLPDGTLTGTWTLETDEFTAYVAVCDCGWRGDQDYPPTEAGQEAAVKEWKDRHLRPLLPEIARRAARNEAPRTLDTFETGALDNLVESAAVRALVVVASLGALAEEAEVRLHDCVDNARRAGASWSAIGDALGITKQATQQRFGGRDVP